MGVYANKNDLMQLQQAVDSILSQSFSDFEFLICDNGSSQEVKKYLDNAAKKDRRITIFRQGDFVTLPEKLNLCLQMAQGAFIARQDADDMSKPHRLQRQVEYLNMHPKIAFVGCAADTIFSNGSSGQRIYPPYPQIKDFFFTLPYLHPTLLFRVGALKEVNGYCESYWTKRCEDYDLLLRMYGEGFQGANLQEKHYFYRVSQGHKQFLYRVNEMITRYRRFRDLRQFPKALPFVVKPIFVGLLPQKVLLVAQHRYYRLTKRGL